MKSRHIWAAVGSSALIATVLLAAGLVYAIQDIVNPQPAHYEGSPAAGAEAPEEDPSIEIVALGDSLSAGIGDASGKGYVQNVKEMLADAEDKPVNVIGNYAKPGYTTGQLLNDLQTQQGFAYAIGKADIVLLTIGGNDLFAIGQDVMQSQTEGLDPAKVRERMPEPLSRLEQILEKLSSMNPKATIVYVGVYNPFYDLPEMREASVYVQEWNDQAFRIANRLPNAVVVPTFDLFQLNLSNYLYSDHFHPNRDGYVRMAERVVQALK